MIGEVVVNIGKARPKVIAASMALPKKLFAPRTAIFRDTYKKPQIYISDNFLELILTFSETLYLYFIFPQLAVRSSSYVLFTCQCAIFLHLDFCLNPLICEDKFRGILERIVSAIYGL